MAILGRNVVLGYGDVGISVNAKGPVADPTFKFQFYQLDSANYDPDPSNKDTSVVPINLIIDLKALELLHRITGELLSKTYDHQLAALELEKFELEQEKRRLQAEKT